MRQSGMRAGGVVRPVGMALAALVLWFLGSDLAFAQTSTGGIRGIVRDETGGVRNPFRLFERAKCERRP